MSPALISRIVGLVAATLIPRLAVGAAIGFGLGRTAGLLIPVFNIVFGIWLLKDITGPAYRVTIPGVVLVIYMRRKLQSNEEEKD